MPGWRNGRRNGLKIRLLKGSAGSTPAPGTSTLEGSAEGASKADFASRVSAGNIA